MSEQRDTSYTFAIQAIGAEATQKALADTKAAEAALVKSSKELGAAQKEAMAATITAQKALIESTKAAAAQSTKAAAGSRDAAGAVGALGKQSQASAFHVDRMRGVVNALGVDAESLAGVVANAGTVMGKAFEGGGVLGAGLAATAVGFTLLIQDVKSAQEESLKLSKTLSDLARGGLDEVATAYAKIHDAETRRRRVLDGMTEAEIRVAEAQDRANAATGRSLALTDQIAKAQRNADEANDSLYLSASKLDDEYLRGIPILGSWTGSAIRATGILDGAKTSAEAATKALEDLKQAQFNLSLLGKGAEVADAKKAEQAAVLLKLGKTLIDESKKQSDAGRKAADAAKQHASDVEAAIRLEIAQKEKLDAAEEDLLQKEVAREKYRQELDERSLAQRLRQRELFKTVAAESRAAAAARGAAAGEKQQGKNDATLATFDTSALDSLLAATGKTGDEIEKLKIDFLSLGDAGGAAFGAIGAAAEAGAMVAGAALGALSQAVQESLTENRYAAELAVQGYEDRLAASDTEIAQLQRERDAASETAATAKTVAEKREAISLRDSKIAAIRKRETELGPKAAKLAAQDAKAAENERVAAVLASLAIEAGTRAIYETAMGLAAAASGNPGAAGHFAAAALLGGLAVSAGATASSMSANRPMSGQERLQFEEGHQARKERAEGRAAEGEERRKEAAGRAAASADSGPTVIINVVGAYMTGEAVGEAVDKALKAYEGVK